MMIMKIRNLKKYRIISQFTIVIAALFIISACNESEILEETPLAFLNSNVVLTNPAGFESVITALHHAARNELAAGDAINTNWSMIIGTDVATTGVEGLSHFRDYSATLTPFYGAVNFYWNWAYLQIFPRANTIIEFAEKPDVEWSSEAQKNAVIAEARFLRGYAYNVLANIYGGVPIVDRLETGPKLDYTRASRQEVLEFAKEDLVFASEWLPETTELDGRIVKAAADHLLSEVYISLEDYENAIASASAVINSGLYQLMTERFGNFANEPGDAYSDLFRDNNQNRSSGNMEMIWNYQIEFQTPGGQGGAGGNNWIRRYSPRYWALKDPDGNSGMMIVDSLGRGVAQARCTNYYFYEIWQDDWDDMRNSEFNIRREWYYNNPASSFFGEKVQSRPGIDTMLILFPMIRKVEGLALGGNTRGRTFKEYPIMRLAETYLLRAEAYMRSGDLQAAADDINVVRARANATPVSPGQVDLDYILDERARELSAEEQRRRTLVRTGTLVERVRKYNIREDTRNSIQEHHRWFPIPQTAIDANIEAELEQNPGYN